MTFDPNLRAAARWGCVAVTTLTSLHIALWPWQRQWSGWRRPVPYLAGVGVLLTACWGWALERRDFAAVRAFSVICSMGGAVVLALWTGRRVWTGPIPPAPVGPLYRKGARVGDGPQSPPPAGQ